jgi:photosystem II stability/assembly factor-like uncharacterized protein
MRTLLLIGVLVALGCATHGNAQPTHGPDRPFTTKWKLGGATAKNLVSIAFKPGGQKGVVVGAGGAITWTEDGGRSWQLAATPTEATHDLWAVALTDRMIGIAVGDRGTLLRSSNGGNTWERAKILGEVGTSLRAVQLVGIAGLAVGAEGLILWSQDEGKTWQRAKTPAQVTSNLWAIAFAGAQTGVAVGERSTILRTEDGGRTWQEAAKPPEPLAQDLLSISFSNDTDGVVVGDSGAILWTDDAGKSWKRAKTPADDELPRIDRSRLWRVVFLNASTGVIIGRLMPGWRTEDIGIADGNQGVVLRTEDGGKTWLRVKMPRAVDALWSVEFSGPRGIVVGDRGIVLRTADAGKTWTQVVTPADAKSDLRGGVLLGPAGGVVVGNHGTTLLTDDAGATWQRAKTPSDVTNNLRKVVLLKGGTGIAVGGEGTLLRTGDYGETWTRASKPTSIASERWAAELWAASFLADGKAGVAVGDKGTILHTDDGGVSWVQAEGPGPTGSLQAVALTETWTGVAVGAKGTILWTGNGGRKWERASLVDPVDGDLWAVAFPAQTVAVAVGAGGTVVRSEDGGRHWMRARIPRETRSFLPALAFSTPLKGVAVGSDGSALWTEDGGKIWQAADMPPDLTRGYLWAVAFPSENVGVAVGSEGVVLRTDDGGRKWIRANKMPHNIKTVLRSVAFASPTTGVAVGDRGVILQTRDAGATWVQVDEGLVRGDLYSIAFGPQSHRGTIVGERGTRLLTGKLNYAPYLKDRQKSVRLSLNGKVELNLQAVDDEGDPPRIAAIEYKVITQVGRDEWRSIGNIEPKSIGENHWRETWAPSERRISDGTKLEHRVFIQDGAAFAPIELNEIVFQSFWHRVFTEYPTIAWTILGLAGVIAAYLLPPCAMLLFTPMQLALTGSAILESVRTLAEDGSSWNKMAGTMARVLVLPWVTRHARVRRAWLDAYRQRTTGFDKLAKEIRHEFLKADDVLDAWVARRLLAARSALGRILLYQARRTYIQVPVHANDDGNDNIMDQPRALDFRSILNRERAVIVIVGPGGSGKTTLACALARWALAEDEATKLLRWTAIPVIVAEDTNDLLASVTAGLRRMVGLEDELDPDIVGALLRRKRVVVIVDALSERGTETQTHLQQLYGSDTPINALVLTTRRELDLGGVGRTVLQPQPIGLQRLVPFIMEYLRRKDLADKFDPRQQLALAQRILQIVETGGGLTVTPLLVTLFVDAAVDRSVDGGGLDRLPADIPEIYLLYLERLNPTDPATPNRITHDLMRRAAMLLARASLGDDLVPTDFLRQDAEQRLSTAGMKEAAALVDRLVANAVVLEQPVAGLSRLRFQLDPVAEYLAAMATCHELGDDRSAWSTMVARLTVLPGYPEAVRGYLAALAACYMTYRTPLKLADIELPWAIAAESKASRVISAA